MYPTTRIHTSNTEITMTVVDNEIYADKIVAVLNQLMGSFLHLNELSINYFEKKKSKFTCYEKCAKVIYNLFKI